MFANLWNGGRWKGWLAAVVAAGCAGCASSRTTLFNDPSCDHQTKHIKGVPTNVEVPTHVRITIHETNYARLSTEMVEDGKEKTTLDLVASSPAIGVSPALTTRHASYQLVRRKEMFAVDTVRPAAGSIMAMYVFGNSKSANYQKLVELDTKVEDKTIDAITGLIKNSVLFAQRKAVAQAAGDKSVTLFPIKSDVACEFFDIHDPDLTDRIQAFMDLHINQCPNPCPGTKR